MNSKDIERIEEAIRKWKASKQWDPVEITGDSPVHYTKEQLAFYTDGTDEEVSEESTQISDWDVTLMDGLEEWKYDNYTELNLFGPVNLRELSKFIHKNFGK